MRVFASAERPAWPASRPDNQKNASRYGSLPRENDADGRVRKLCDLPDHAGCGTWRAGFHPAPGKRSGPRVRQRHPRHRSGVPRPGRHHGSHSLSVEGDFPCPRPVLPDPRFRRIHRRAVDHRGGHGRLPVGRCPDRQPRHVDYRHAGGLHLRRDHRLPDPGRPDHARAQGPQVPGAGGDGRVDQHSVRGAGGVAADYPQPHPGARTGIDRFAGPALPVAGLPRHASAAGATVRLLLPAGRRPGSTGRRRWSPGSWYSAR